MIQVSQPYKPGDPVYWTTYTYDGLGRTLTMALPDGSTTSYVYQSNTTKVTDPAGKWKTTTTDVQGNITLVTEPDPASQAGTACYTTGTPPLAGPMQTCYQYDTLEHLTHVTMPRSNGTQNRSWVYNSVTTNLTEETQPESGRTQYTYSNDLVVTKTDANLSVTTYNYDSYGRPSLITRAAAGQAADPCQSTHLIYDQNLKNPSANAWGRLAMSYEGDLDSANVVTGNPICLVQTVNGATSVKQGFTEDFSYSPAGLVTRKTLQMKTVRGAGPMVAPSWTEILTCNPDGSPTTIKYPDVLDLNNNVIRNHTVTYEYNPLGQVGVYYSDILGGSQPAVTNSYHAIEGTSYNAAGQPPCGFSRKRSPFSSDPDHFSLVTDQQGRSEATLAF